MSKGVNEGDLRDVPRWRDSDRFDELERAVVAYADAVSGKVSEVTDADAMWLKQKLGEPALVELTMMVALENMRSRVNGALGLRSQGFSDRCTAQ